MEQLRTMTPAYFSNMFNQNSCLNLFPKLVVRKYLTCEAQAWLIRNVTIEEIRPALFQTNSDKAPGPDGFNPGFHQKIWEPIAPNLCKATLYFFQTDG